MVFNLLILILTGLESSLLKPKQRLSDSNVYFNILILLDILGEISFEFLDIRKNDYYNKKLLISLILRLLMIL